MFSLFKSSSKAAPAGDTLAAGTCYERFAEGATMLDVRTPGEFGKGHLMCAQNVDVMANDFRQRVEELGLDPSKPVYLYCRSGNRSGQAAKILRQMGFVEAFNVGSFDALKAVGFETD